MDLTQIMQCDVQLPPAMQSTCLGALGAALRQEEKSL